MSTPVSIITDAWYEAILMNPSWRRGQALFNVIYEYSPRIAEELRASDVNPYYSDDNIVRAICWLHERIES